MAAIPRIVTADSTGTIARIVRSAIDLLEISVIHIDVPTASDALEEAKKANLAITAFELDEVMKGFEFALRVKRESPTTSVIILGEEDDPAEFDEETAMDSPFIYMSRPVDIHKFLRVLIAGMESHEAMVNALLGTTSVSSSPAAVADLGEVPHMELAKAQPILDSLLQDLGAMAIILATRTGETLLERGATGYINRDQLAGAIVPIMKTNMDVRELVGGDVSSVQFYDGEDYDVFVLTVGLHHFICVLFEGQMGSRQFGMVNRFGRSAVQDMIALLGANAFFVQTPAKKPAEPPKRPQPKRVTQETEIIALERAVFAEDFTFAEETIEEEPEVVSAPVPFLEPVSNLDMDKLFGGDVAMGEDLFDMENIEVIARAQEEKERKGTLDISQAEELGLFPKQ